MMALAQNCVHPGTKEPYIKSLTGGKQNSGEPIKVQFLDRLLLLCRPI